MEHFNWLTDTLGAPFKDSFAKTSDHVPNGRRLPTQDLRRPSKEKAACSSRPHHVEGDNGGPMFMRIVTENVETRKH